ncbi:hypothetical protein Tco_0712019 [Tanacetum coccineum]
MIDGRGASSRKMLGSAPLGPYFSISPSVKLSVAGCGGVGKGGSCVLIPDLVVMAKVGASGCISFEMEETFMDGDSSSYRSSWYRAYSSIQFHPSSSVRELKRN